MPKNEDFDLAEHERRFAAFISYSHADAKAAEKLQRQLERYRLPEHVKLTPDGDSPRLGIIFRDRDDLAAAPSLSDAIRNALRETGALVVICSPDAKKSRWVSEEIALFRQLHPERPVLAALVNGQLDDAFPAALTAGGIEPLAADLRKEGDGWPLGFLKIVAGIAGVPLDSLVQRDAQRRVRRVTAITLAALTAMLAMTVMTGFAITARNEAARQRASAEGLVEYMLTDLRTKLKGVGRIDVMEGVNQRAMEHYRGQGDLSGLSADALERRARILHAMGEDDKLRGDAKSALEKFREAHRTTGTLLARDANNPDRIFGHAQSEYWVGSLALARLDSAAARPYFERYKQLADRLGAIDANNPKWRREQGYADGNLCSFWLQSKQDNAKALSLCQSALGHMQASAKLAPEDPEIQADIVNRLAWLAEAYRANSQPDLALSSRRKQLAAADKLTALDKRNADWNELKIIAQLALAEELRQSNDSKQAESATLLERAVADLQRLITQEPQNEFRKKLLQKANDLRNKGD